MSTLDDWLTDAVAALGTAEATDDPPVPAELRTALLDLTRETAHGITRIAGPLTCYLVGIAVGRGADPATAVSAVSAAVQEHLARTTAQEQ